MVAMEEGRHVAAALLAFVCDGTDDVDGYVWAEEAQEDELVAVGVPEGGVGIVAEVALDDLSADIEVLAVGVAAEGGPEEAAVEGAVEEASLALGAAFDLDVAEEALPGLVGFLADLLEGLLEHLCLEVLAGVLDADEAEAELDFEGGWAYIVAEVNEGYLVLGVALDLDAGDGEVADGIEFSREEMFYGNSIGLTSLMFARYDTSMILDAVKQLDSMGVACLSYKPIFFKELPEEVLAYSETNNFPIYEITDDAFFEDIVLAVKKEAGLDMTEKEVEEAFEKVLKDSISDNECARLMHMVLPKSGEYLQAVCFEGISEAETVSDPFDRDHMVRYSRRLSLDPRYADRVTFERFRQGGLVFMTRNEESAGDMDVLDLRQLPRGCLWKKLSLE